MTSAGNEKLASALGFAMKAGKLRSGEFAAAKAVKEGRALAAVLDSSASENAKKHWSQLCKNADVPLIYAEGVGRAIGKESHMIACITDRGFANMILAARNENEQYSGV